MSTLCFYAQFTASKVGVNSLTVTWDIEQVARADGTRTALVTGGANGITVGRRGLYGYVLTNADLTLYDYIATAITSTTTVDLQEVPALWTLWSISWHDIATSIMSIAGSIGKLLVDNIDDSIAAVNSYIAIYVAKEAHVDTSIQNSQIAIQADIASIPSAPTVVQIDTQLSGTHGSGAWGPGSGIGAISYTPPRITDPSHNPIDGVQIWVTTDEDGVNIQASGFTNALGLLSTPFLLDAGTYYLWKQCGGYDFTNPETVVVS